MSGYEIESQARALCRVLAGDRPVYGLDVQYWRHWLREAASHAAQYCPRMLREIYRAWEALDTAYPPVGKDGG